MDYGNIRLCYLIKTEENEFASGENTLYKQGFIKKSSLFFGEEHDYNGFDYNWNTENADLNGWKTPEICKDMKTEFYIQSCNTDKIIRSIKPLKLKDFGEYSVYDAGLNLSGYAVVQCDEPNQKVEIKFSELLSADGNLDPLSAGWNQTACDTFITDGKTKEFFPRFLWHGFRYFSLTNNANPAEVREVHADIPVSGDFKCSDQNLNWLFDTFVHTQLSNMHSGVPSDCPHRERLGYTGDGRLCAAAAMLIAVQNGRQAALMVPTEILARQHYAELSPLFSAMGYACGLLIGATPAAEKRRIKKALAAPEAAGRLPIVIGTHALLSEDVQFAAPGLVVTDEQHRFGAAQRALLSEKNHYAHLLVMSATPIPRSLALILYGDLEISRIDGMPPGRQRVSTYVVDESYRARLDGFIRRQVGDGGQVYIVCPAVEGGEEMDAGELTLAQICSGDEKLMQEPKAAPSMKAAVNYAEELTKIFPELSVAFLHGKMKSAEKDDVMRRFTAGEVQILVSTTVIEVGVNVPNACLMIVENAERFGLSQLHQLRGRVGRGTRKSYCILVTGDEGGTASHAKERLEVLRTTYDGYRIAEEDLAQRGPGDFLACEAGGAVRQSGALAFRLADAGEDVGLMKEATEDARALIRSDPELQTAPLLSARIAELFAPESGYIS